MTERTKDSSWGKKSYLPRGKGKVLEIPRLPSRCSRDLCSSAMLCDVGWWLVASY